MEIRTATATDADAILEIYAPFVRETAISFETGVPTCADMQSRLCTTLVNYPWLVASAGGDVVAYAYGSPHRTRSSYRWSCDVSIYAGEAVRRQGVGRALYGALLHVLRHQGFANAFGGITLPNDASVGLHEAMGFRKIGAYERVGYKLGRWHTVGWWGLALQYLDDAPSEPIPFADLAGEVDAIIANADRDQT